MEKINFNPISSIAGVIKEGIKYLMWLQKTSNVRRMRKCIEYGEKYIQVNEKSGQFRKISNKEQLKLLRKYARLFFNMNN